MHGGARASGTGAGRSSGGGRALRKGELLKRREHLKTWKPRLFALLPHRLVYYVPDNLAAAKVSGTVHCC